MPPHLLLSSFLLVAPHVYNCSSAHICRTHFPLTNYDKFRFSSPHHQAEACDRQGCVGRTFHLSLCPFRCHLPCLCLCLSRTLCVAHQPLSLLSRPLVPLSTHRWAQLCRWDHCSGDPIPHTRSNFFGGGLVGHGRARWAGQDVLGVCELRSLILSSFVLEVGRN